MRASLPRAPGSAGRLLGGLLLLGGCQPLHYGETLVVVDTDVSVPRFVGALRIDLFQPDGTWFDTRDVPAFDRAQWPLSFGLVTTADREQTVRVRLRGYPEGRRREYLGERFEEASPPLTVPRVPESLADLCGDPPLLPPRTRSTLRFGGKTITAPLATAACPVGVWSGNASGAVAVRVEIPSRGAYRFEMLRIDPPDTHALLYLRSDCRVQSSQVACRMGSDEQFVTRIMVPDLRAGSYVLIAGSMNRRQPADVTLAWTSADDIEPYPAPGPSPPPEASEGDPRFVVDGVDLTPTTEPRPRITIDRLVDIRVTPETRRTATVILRGECFGTMADLRGGRTCMDTAGRLEPVGAPEFRDGISSRAASASGSWEGEREVPCDIAPRARRNDVDGTPLLDEEVCIPGGAFLLGDAASPFDSGDAAEQVVVVEPFLLDKYEFTVGRYRQALRENFSLVEPDVLSTDASPLRNDGPLSDADLPASAATWNGTAKEPAPLVGASRERFPVNMIAFPEAEGLCRFLASRLPSEAEWEYAAAAAGRTDGEARYPVGDAPPGCEVAAIGRPFSAIVDCPDQDAGPVAVDAEPWASGDLTANGVVGMTGGVSEWVADSYRPYRDSCWRQRLLRGVACEEPAPLLRTRRGGHWEAGWLEALASSRSGVMLNGRAESLGFRCARAGRR